jgi:hypothetical protein
MATIADYGGPTDTLAAPSLSEWAAAVAAAVGGVGGVAHGTASVPSATTGGTALAAAGTPGVWGGATTTAAAVTVPVKGWYDISCHGWFNSAATGTVRMLWVADSVTATLPPAGQYIIGQYATVTASTSGVGAALAAAGVWLLEAGASVRIWMRQDSGSPLPASATLSVHLVRPF